MKISYCLLYAERITVRLVLSQQSIRMSREEFHSLVAHKLFELWPSRAVLKNMIFPFVQFDLFQNASSLQSTTSQRVINSGYIATRARRVHFANSTIGRNHRMRF